MYLFLLLFIIKLIIFKGIILINNIINNITIIFNFEILIMYITHKIRIVN